MTTATITVPVPAYCEKCRFCEVQRDPDPYDSFCSDDVKMICTFKRQRTIDIALRPYQVSKVKRPSWCPLTRSKQINKKK